jgi:EAL domain-containing protein (putative c-di-GMP-specific phosphodiesterase class I)
VFRPELDRHDASRLGLLADLRTAIAGNTLEVHYQPKFDVETGVVQGAEALVRWRHPLLGPVTPDEFVPLAEQSSLITPMTMLVLRRALRDCERWRSSGRRLSVAVNMSPRSLLDPGFVDQVAEALAAVDLPTSAVTLEITEDSLMSDPEGAIAAIRRLKELGVKVSVDDLGTGYSSLAYLQRLPVDEIKIDRSFLADFTDGDAQAVVGALVDLGHRLGRHVVAEGVEDEATLLRLRDMRCDTAQGFHLARPMSAGDFLVFLEQHASVELGADPRGGLRLIR